MTSAVADAGPLIHLAEIGCLSLLKLFDVLHVPDAVWQESVRPDRVTEDDLLALSVIRRHTLQSGDVAHFVSENDLARLQAGEIEALHLARQISVETLLTDDLAVRNVARRLGLVAVGSLGVIAGAYHRGGLTLTEAEQHMMNPVFR